MRHRSPLNHRQLAVLERIAGGDDLATADTGSKRSATALHDRGLLVVRRSPWRAAITDAGRFYVERGRYPDRSNPLPHTQPEQRNDQQMRTDPATSRTSATSHASSALKRRKRPPHTTARITAERQSAAIDLIEELVVAGEKVIRKVDDAAQAHWRQVVDFAKRNRLVPDGKRIEKTKTRRGDLQIRLLNGPHANCHNQAVPTVPMPMPTELHGLHPVVKALQDDTGRLSMAGSLRRRCLRYLHGLTQEAVRRGYQVQEQPVAAQYRGRITTYGRPGVPDYSRREGELNLVVDGFSYLITIDQEHPEAEDDERYDQLYVWVRGPGQPHGCRTRWRDGKRTTMDSSIAPVLRDIETWAAAATREQQDRRVRWRAAMDEATRLATHDRLVAELEDQVRHWRQIQDLRQYCDALEQRIREVEVDEPIDEARRWLAWARDHAEIMDPLFQLPVTPMPKLRPEDLEPYLDGWSLRGPDEYPPRRRIRFGP